MTASRKAPRKIIRETFKALILGGPYTPDRWIVLPKNTRFKYTFEEVLVTVERIQPRRGGKK